jgi:hypothetical protein
MQQSLTMPLARYFLGVGGVLLALLLGLNAYLPSQPAPAVAGATVADAAKPVVRIHSTQKLPERIVIDTSLPTIVPAPAVIAAAPAKKPALDALAQISASDLKVVELKAADPKKPEPKAPPKRRVAKRQVRQPLVAYAQAPTRWDFDLFARN